MLLLKRFIIPSILILVLIMILGISGCNKSSFSPKVQVIQNSVSVNNGPLTFSLKIEDEYNKLNSAETAIRDSKWQEGADPEKWPSFEIEPLSPWNYGLIVDKENISNSFSIIRNNWPADNYPLSAENTPIEIKARWRKIPSWKIHQYGLVDVLPGYPVKTSAPVEELTLIPMGAARLGISAFPQLDN